MACKLQAPVSVVLLLLLQLHPGPGISLRGSPGGGPGYSSPWGHRVTCSQCNVLQRRRPLAVPDPVDWRQRSHRHTRGDHVGGRHSQGEGCSHAVAKLQPLCRVLLCIGGSCSPPVYSAQASAAETTAAGAQSFQPSSGAHLSEVNEAGPGVSALLQSKLGGRCYRLSLDVA